MTSTDIIDKQHHKDNSCVKILYYKVFQTDNKDNDYYVLQPAQVEQSWEILLCFCKPFIWRDWLK